MIIEQLHKELQGIVHSLLFDGFLRVGNFQIDLNKSGCIENILKEWVLSWLESKSTRLKRNSVSEAPDIFLDPDDHTRDLLEVKAFNYEATPGFDIADFKSYQREIIREPWMLHTKYIIFGYAMDDAGVVTIKRLWLKNVWEICRPSAKWAINVQFKNGMVQKIRPATWYSKSKAIHYLPFENVEDFLAAIEETVYANPETRSDAVGWRSRMEKSYAKFYGTAIKIPRWMDISSKYII